MCNEIEGSYDKIMITIVPSYTEKISPFVAVGIVTHAAACNNTDGNKLVIFSGMALYYGDNCRTP